MAILAFKAGPVNGAPEKGAKNPKSAKSRVKKTYNYALPRIFAIIWIGIDGYLLYAFCYNIVWHHVRFRNRAAAIALLVIFCVLNFYVIMSFMAMYLWGPGKITPDYRGETESNFDPDAPFLCDQNGYSFYCTYCKHVKPNRTHHSAYSDTCVPQMDHFCPWVGMVVGQGNVKFFLQFAGVACAGQLVVLVTLFVYQHGQVPHINGNSIAMYIVSGLAFGFTSILFLQHILYVAWGHSTLEHLGYRRYGAPFINIPTADSRRRIVQPTPNEIMMPKSSPFSQGVRENFRRVMGPWYTWLFPIRTKIREPKFNQKFLDILEARLLEEDEKEHPIPPHEMQQDVSQETPQDTA